MSSRLPLSALLSQALVAFTIEFDNEFEHRAPHCTTSYGSTGSGPWLASMAMWSTCMRFAPRDGISAGELEQHAGVRTNLNGMERWGYIVIDAPGLPGRAKRITARSMVRPTAKGRMAQEIWAPLFSEIESRWQERFGAGEVEELRRALCALIDQFDAGLPDCLPILGYGLFSRLVAHKSAPQPGIGGDSAGLSLPALLSKALLAFTIEFESGSDVSLAIGANVLRIAADQDPDESMLMRDLPRKAGVSKESIAMALSFLEKRGYAVVKTAARPTKAKAIHLTLKGRGAADAFERRIAMIEDDWQRRFGSETLFRLRTALEKLSGDSSELSPLLQGIDPYPDCWRASLPRPATLPHFPMILHRGGFPDGS